MYRLTDLNQECSFTGYVPFSLKSRNRVNILALGDVGGTLLIGLKLQGGDVIDQIGIYDVNPQMSQRYEIEMNQIAFPFDGVRMPEVKSITEEKLFDCDIFIFCASRAVPAVAEKVKDVRMAQFESNRIIIEQYAKMASKRNFKGLFAVISDPVDPLCKAAYLAGEKLRPEQIQGFGLGVMNSRAIYFAKRDNRFRLYLEQGRAFGPHGQDLVIADSILDYHDQVSEELTRLTVQSNLDVRNLGFKPYIAPALSSGTISILLTLRGEWHYSSNFIGKEKEGAFMGALNRMTSQGTRFEETLLPEKLFLRIKNAYDNLRNII
ncbi:lactate/malate family dehydrogenase [Aminipila terrae]|uniref:Lactate dehydrogenase n=1 Tax=Aminipila terrae TaxID=2697030 RepID=A0A6P1MF94_9FIRM|nr:lactate dehydrogenase [Aminipila terrae]QHI71274.1 lactate dehydrogenase [Aminipila terrae]